MDLNDDNFYFDYEHINEVFTESGENYFDLNVTSTNSSDDDSDNYVHDEFELASPIVTGTPEMLQNEPTTTNKRKQMTNDERWEVYNALLEKSVAGKLKKNTTRVAEGKKTSNDEVVNVSHKRKGVCGRKKIEIDMSQVGDIPLHRRTTIRSLAAALNVSPSRVYACLKYGLVRRHSNAIKPQLREDNKKCRLQFCLSMLDKFSPPHLPKFIDMYNIVHIDEKWFYMTKKKETYYLLPSEDDPLRTCQSKNFIGKVMFLDTIARPRFNEEGNETFSGQIGIFPFVSMQPAQRRSRNRDAGTMELKAMVSIKRDDIRSCLIAKVLPKILEMWPLEDFGKTIFIQQDNARTHVQINDAEFQEAASRDGFDIRLMCQPPNSPDLNILDLGFFRAIQALKDKVCPKTVEELVAAVETAFEEYPTRQINRIFLTLQSCMQEIMKIRSSNTYKIPHMKKKRLEREGPLPILMACDIALVQEVITSLAS